MSQRISTLKNLRTVKALRGESLRIDLEKTFTGTLTAWMKKDSDAPTYREFTIEDNRYLVLTKNRASDYYDISTELLTEAIQGKWYFDVRHLPVDGTEDDEQVIFTGTILFENNITGSVSSELVSGTTPFATEITGLTDIPDDYGTPGQILAMNSLGTSTEWITPVPLYDDTTIQSEVDLNTLKVSNVDHPLVETAVPTGALFTDTIYDDSEVLKDSDTLSNVTASNKLLTESDASTLISGTIGNLQTVTDTGASTTNSITIQGVKISNGLGVIDSTTVIGNGAMSAPNSPSAVDCTALGYNALKNNISRGNTAIGSESLLTQINGQWNTSVGFETMKLNVYGSHNSAFGQGALQGQSFGQANTAIGSQALKNSEGNGGNVAIGYAAGAFHAQTNLGELNDTNTCTYLGAYTKANTNVIENATAVGFEAIAQASNTMTFGNVDVTDNYFQGVVRAKSFISESYTFSTLPSGVVGQLASITDASNVGYRGTANGGGSDYALVTYNGTGWIYH